MDPAVVILLACAFSIAALALCQDLQRRHRAALATPVRLNPTFDPTTDTISTPTGPTMASGATITKPPRAAAASATTSYTPPKLLRQPAAAPAPAVQRRRVWMTYSPILPDELHVVAGEWVAIESYGDGGWARGTRANGDSGLFPVYCLDPETGVAADAAL
ncbi:hypothetical protein H9P43_007072 [Blastocladiella emersonii ATCC 22665]|nr:hypothetical protein H9P43_007072 [Blastocladiella emersonii ATCC 22665]